MSISAKGLVLIVMGTLLGACKPYKLEPPPGFAEVTETRWETRMKGSESVGLNLRVWENPKGGTLPFWSEDLVRKLARRGYRLVAQRPVESRNGVVGTRLDFSYDPPGDDEGQKFYSAALFVTDKYRVVIQLAGDEELGPRYLARVDEIVGQTKIRGCRAWTKVCDGPQPDSLAALAEVKDPPPNEDAAEPSDTHPPGEPPAGET